ncbi:homeobox-leucine zipper protein HOX20-like [Salvia miltiorrhiza]|uniref:homeobox-leucine zipper protein HOX20-like n=1 Tax=Salvia miltiorrhiza TaxID=226208 RepID=UPI0025AC2D39|nr:homeobox-leucine zipper protein HOX20-like [Salvia miltiorrhiza]
MNRFQVYQVDALEEAFQERDHLSRERKAELVDRTGLDVEQVTSWFNRRRKRERDRETRRRSERRNSELEEALRESREREAVLQREVEDSKRRETALTAEIQSLRHQIGGFGQLIYQGL